MTQNEQAVTCIICAPPELFQWLDSRLRGKDSVFLRQKILEKILPEFHLFCLDTFFFIDVIESFGFNDTKKNSEVIMKGRVKWFNKNKGYGFIITEENKEYFVHWKSIVTNSPRELKVLEQDEFVTFDLMETDKGVQAINIIRVNP